MKLALSDRVTNVVFTLVLALATACCGFRPAASVLTPPIDSPTCGNATRTKVTMDRGQKVATTTTSPASTSSAVQVSVNGQLQTETSTTVATPTQHFYDALGREVQIKDPLGNNSFTTYDATTGQVTSRRRPNGQITLYSYYPPGGRNAGLLAWEEQNGGKRTYYDYNAWGQITHIWGHVPYPEMRTYDEFGDLKTLTTYRSGSTWSQAAWPEQPPPGDVTTWTYDEPTGLLISKKDAANHEVTYDYELNHYPKSTHWSRSGASMTRVYHADGDLAKIETSGDLGAGTTIEYGNYSRLGLPRNISDASGSHTLTYSPIGQLVRDECTLGLLNGVVLNQRYDSLLRKDRFQVQRGDKDASADYIFSTLGRLGVVSNGVHSATYAYAPNSDLIETTTHSGSGATLVAKRQWNLGYRLFTLDNRVNGDALNYIEYQYDANDRRTSAKDQSKAEWYYGYNDRGELRTAHKYGRDRQPVSGQIYEYDYDPIGDRTATRTGGDSNGENLSSASYAPNALNQYTSRGVPGKLEVIGESYPDATVTVNGTLAAYRKGIYFHHRLDVENSSGPVVQNVTISASRPSESRVESGTVLFPPATQTFTYDEDGNLTGDSLWTYSWDGQNQLIRMESVEALPASVRKRLDFTYDHQGRRIQKVVTTWNGSEYVDYVPPQITRFVYDDWRLIAELDSANQITRSYMWGIDLSGSLDGAAGIGGLVGIRDHVQNKVWFPTFDGNGNVTALINASNGTAEAIYEYGPFGEVVRASGTQAKANPTASGSKYTDLETGLTYYGLRYYNSSLGRWIGADPIGIEGGLNLYAFIANAPVGDVDSIGLNSLAEEEGAIGAGATVEGGVGVQAVGFLGRVRSAVNAFNDTQQFISDLSDLADKVEGGDSTEILIAGLTAASSAFGGNLKGVKSAVASVGNTTVYQAFGKNFETIYVGITKRFGARAREHLKDKGISIVKIKGLEKLTPTDARAAEQALIELHGLKKNGGSLINIINSIAKSNPAYAQMLRRGNELLKKVGYPGAN